MIEPNDGRKIVEPCYDHISGLLGETLFTFLVKNNWIQKRKNQRDYTITKHGWNELELIGINIQKLQATKRKQIAPCIERHHGIFHEHPGAYLGALLTDWLFERGWIIEKAERQLGITKKGLNGLHSFGVDISKIKEYL